MTMSKQFKKLSYVKTALGNIKFVTAQIAKSNFEKDLMLLLKKRPSQSLPSKSNLSIKDLRLAVATDQSYRSRVVYIKIELEKYVGLLGSGYNLLSHKLYFESTADFPVTTKLDKRAVVNNYLEEKYGILDECNRLVQICQYIIDDIDKTAWSLRDLLKMFELSTRPELNL